MKFIPADAYISIEFDKVIAILQSYCIAEHAAAYIHNHPFYLEVDQVNVQLDYVSEYKSFIELGEDFPLAYYADVKQSLKELATVGYVLELDQIREIQHIISTIYEIDSFLTSERKDKAPNLNRIYDAAEKPSSLNKIIPNVINDEGQVKDNASPELLKIVKAIRTKEQQVFKEFNQILSKYKQQGVLSQSEESYRNGRRVLSIPSEYKRKIKGIIHDESGTGKTTFIEPESVVYINNEILELQVDKRKEIYKILKELCNSLREYGPLIEQYQEILTEFDIIRAKAKFAVSLEAKKPKIVDKPCFKLKNAFHPLLLLKNQKLGLKTVPMTLELEGSNRIFLISGPNAGGKSVSLKTVGLIQLMTQIGCLTPVDADSEIGLYTQLCCDIGDQQSLEDDLSTYSSRLKNMKNFLDFADEKSLVLIDEFGSGTDPKMGGSIAQSILFELNKKKVFAVITTHYSNLKVFAFKTKGIVNGAMHFDQEKLQPTYELIVGKPGSSFAFEIAEKVGLPKKLLHFAKKNAGVNLRAMDKLINDLQSKQKQLDDKMQSLEAKEKQVDKLTKSYHALQKDMEYKRKKFKKEKKEFEVNDKIQDKRALEKLVKELRENQNLEKAKVELEKAKVKQQQVQQTVAQLNEEILEEIPLKEAPVVGDHVKTRNGSMKGILVKINKKEAIIEMGNMQLTAPLSDCIKIGKPLVLNPKKRVNTYLSTETSGLSSKLDIRGYRRSEALLLLEEFLDNSLITNASLLEIIHGTGNGVLRKAVRQKVREYKDVKEVSSPPDDQGGEGVTLIKF